MVDIWQSRKSIVEVRDYYIRNTANFPNLDILASWKMCIIIWEYILPGILRHWVQHVTCLCRHRGEAPTHSQTSARRWVDSATHSGHLTPRKDALPIVQQALGPVWMAWQISSPPEFNSRPSARSKSLYQLHYPGRHMWRVYLYICDLQLQVPY